MRGGYYEEREEVEHQNMTERPSPEETALKLWQEKFPDSAGILLAGSVMRGEGTPNSDLDLVVIYEKIATSWRESFYFQGWPIEVFVNDLETLNYFFEKVDKPSGVPVLQNMVAEGKEIPGPAPALDKAKALARKGIAAGPIVWTEKELKRGRYTITDICDDMKNPRNPAELTASAVRLYEVLTEFYFRSQNKWSARGKSIPRKWRQENPELGRRFESAFASVFQHSDQCSTLKLAEEILTPYGGWLFADAKSISPQEWKLPLENTQ
ncbi:MAG: nucleotidyltransferase domain-containing protein [Bdellovibrionota bacterium]